MTQRAFMKPRISKRMAALVTIVLMSGGLAMLAVAQAPTKAVPQEVPQLRKAPMPPKAPAEYPHTLKQLHRMEGGKQIPMTGGLTLPDINQTRPNTNRRAVRARKIMTRQERREYRRIMKAATYEIRQQIRETTYARLRQRAWERGMILVEPAIPHEPGMRWTENSHQHPTAGEPHPYHPAVEPHPYLASHLAFHPPRAP